MQGKQRKTTLRRLLWYGLCLSLLLWAIWSGFFTLDPRLAAIKEEMAFLLKRNAISPAELQWALEQVEKRNLEEVEAFLAERIALVQQQQAQTRSQPRP
ncbi:MAG: hypothetical protein D6736_06225 [Nitrospinota bacterium]|nr:MAG: hypothetical protein D6736_06225 [Nitrospinota bacterium]